MGGVFDRSRRGRIFRTRYARNLIIVHPFAGVSSYAAAHDEVQQGDHSVIEDVQTIRFKSLNVCIIWSGVVGRVREWG